MSGLVPINDDLLLVGLNRSTFIARSAVRAGVALAATAALLYGWLLTAGSVSSVLVVLCLLGCPCASWLAGTRKIRVGAERLRGDMDLAVAVFLDLVNVLLAGGAGVETSMLAAASAGDGWAFEQIRLSLARAQSSRRSYWDALSELGRSLRVESLEDVAHSVQLSGEHGARVRQSLVAKAQAIRARNLARIEHEAEERTEHMGLPIVVLFVGFILLVGYPAFTATMGSL